MVLNSRSGSHRLLMRQLDMPIGEKDEEEDESAEDDEEEEQEDEDLEQEVQQRPGVEAHQQRQEEEQQDAEDGEEEDLFGQIASANPELLQQPPPIQMPRCGNQGFGRDDWADGATFALLQAWGDKCMQLNKWHLRLEHWAELAATVTHKSNSHKTDIQCKNRVDTLKKKFKHEKQKQALLGTPSKWPFYRILDRLLSMANSAASAKNNNNNNRLSSSNNNTNPVIHGKKFNNSNINSVKNNLNSNYVNDFSMGNRLMGLLPCIADAGNLVKVCNVKKKAKNFSSPHFPKDLSATSSSDDEDDDPDEGSMWGLNAEAEDVYTNRKRKKKKRRLDPGGGTSSLAAAISKLGEIFERMEECKRQQLVDLEKIRMQFTRDLELHRMQLLMQTQMELAKIRQNSIEDNVDIDTHLG